MPLAAFERPCHVILDVIPSMHLCHWSPYQLPHTQAALLALVHAAGSLTVPSAYNLVVGTTSAPMGWGLICDASPPQALAQLSIASIVLHHSHNGKSCPFSSQCPTVHSRR